MAIFAHEMHELNALRSLFKDNNGVMRAIRLHELIEAKSRTVGILHLEAWDVGDELVWKMREGL